MNLSGEWWIIDGVAHFADGDVGDMNHEAYVHEHVYRELSDRIEAAKLDAGLAYLFASHEAIPDAATLRGGLNDWSDGYAGNLPDDHPEKDLLYDDPREWLAGKVGMEADDLTWVFDADQSTCDLRKYGIEKLGWIRVAGNKVELWSLDQSKLKTIADGLWDAHQDEVDDAKIDIAEMKPDGRYYDSVPYIVIAAEKMAGLRDYCRTPKIPLSALDHQ